MPDRFWLGLEAAFVAGYVLAAIAAGAHAVLNKRDSRSAWGWIAICWMLPFGGPLLYYLAGMNRLGMQALRRVEPVVHGGDDVLPALGGASAMDVRELVRTGRAMSGWPLLPGNAVEPLVDGDEAYPAMLAAIAQASRTISLVTYIYRDDAIGRRFAKALAEARARGVEVRILLDGLSDFIYRPRASRLLRKHGLMPQLFLPLRIFPPMLHVNLRNHRKLLIVDSAVAFTGGINIAQYHIVKQNQESCVRDLHFRLRGPVVEQLEAVFAADWRLATGEAIAPAQAAPAPGGNAAARVIRDGPDDEVNRLDLLLQGALATAHERVWIMTPYLVPGAPMLGALQAAALRGVDVCLLIPARSDQPWVDWATRHLLWQLLQSNVRVLLTPPPFCHSKLFLMDGYYAQIGTANLDHRSMRLNFELSVECYDPRLVERLAAHFLQAAGASRAVTLPDVEGRPLLVRLRDGFFWLFSPFL